MGRNVIFGHVTMLPESNQGKSSFQSADLQTQLGNVNQVVRAPSGPISSARTTTPFPWRLSGDKLLVAVNRQRRCGPSRLSVNDNENIFSMGEGSRYNCTVQIYIDQYNSTSVTDF